MIVLQWTSAALAYMSVAITITIAFAGFLSGY